MAAQRVQNYLKKHKIGPLFESLMARVIQDTPDDPIGYIIKILQGMHKKQSKQLENSFNGQISSRPSSRHSTLSQSENRGNEKRTNHLAASWSPGVAQQEGRKQSHEKQFRTTWSANNPETPQPQPSWNSDTRVPTHDFDELFQMQNGDAKPSPAQPLEKYQGVRSWDGEQKPTGEQRIAFEPSDNDEITRELRLGKSSTNQALSTPTSSGSRPVKSRRAVEKHRQELQALLLEDSSPVGKRRTAGKHSPEENGTEIFERKEDLQEEGVATLDTRSGAKLNKLKRNENKEVSVTICARCARIIGKNDNEDTLSQATSSDFNGRLFDDITTKQDLDKFESASEASGYVTTREKNAWNMPSDSEYESSPRHKASTVKNVGGFSRKEPKHMYKYRDTDDSPVPTHRSTARSHSSHFDDTSRGFSNPARNAWRIDDDNSDESDNAEIVQLQRRSSSQAAGKKSRAWFPRGSGGNNSDDDSTLTRD